MLQAVTLRVLRWALSKVRKVVDKDGVRRIVADRERVTLMLDDLHVELRHIWFRLNDDPPIIPPAELRNMAELFEMEGEMVDGVSAIAVR